MDDLETLSDQVQSIKIEIRIPNPTPLVVKVPSRKVEPKVEPLIKDSSKMQAGDDPGTLEKVRKHGSQLEKVAVHNTEKFSFRGVTVKDSRAS